MSAIPQLKLVGSSPAPRGSQLIDLAEAARRSGLHPDHLRRLCRERYAPAKLAEQRTPDEGGKPTWFIWEHADPLFSRVPTPERQSAAFDITRLTTDQRRILLARKQLLDDWQSAIAGGLKLGFRVEQVTEQFCNRVEAEGRLPEGTRSLAFGTLYNWKRAFDRDGLAGLVDGRWKLKSEDAPGEYDEFFAFFRAQYLGPNRKSIAMCHALAEQKAQEMHWPAPSYKACQRYVATIPAQVRIRYRHGKKAFEDQCEPAIRRDYTTLQSNDLWCGDHHDLDVMVLDPASTPEHPKFLRPNITAWQDMRSRKIVGWHIHATAGNSDTILQAFVSAARTHGLPKGVYIDNGKDYDSRALQGITKRERREGMIDSRAVGAFTILAVEVTHVWPYHGQSKPIERFFGTLCDRFSKLWDTYCGKDTLSKPEELQARLAAGKAPTLAELTDAFAQWLDGDYHNRIHSGDGMEGSTPAAVFQQCLASKRTVSEELLLFATMPAFGPVRVGKHGVTCRGLHYGAMDANVQKLYGKQVMLREVLDDKNAILVCDLEGRLICRTTLNVKLAFDADQQLLREAIQEKKKSRRILKEYQDQRPHMAEDTHALLARAAARKAAQETPGVSPVSPPPSIAPARTAFDDQLPAIQRALNRAPIAVGAEGFDDDRVNAALAHMRLAGDDEEEDTFGKLQSVFGQPAEDPT